MEVIVTTIKRILLVEDNSKDVELTLSALNKYNLINDVEVAPDGVEALDSMAKPPARPVVITYYLRWVRLPDNFRGDMSDE